MKAPASLPRLCCILLVTAPSLLLCAAQTYTVTDLGTLPGGGYSVARRQEQQQSQQRISLQQRIDDEPGYTGWAVGHRQRD